MSRLVPSVRLCPAASDYRVLRVASYVAFLVGMTVSGCGKQTVIGPATEEATEYVNHVVDLMERWWFRRPGLSWPNFRAQTLQRAAGAVTLADTHDPLFDATWSLGDRHSRFLPPSVAGGVSPQTHPAGQRLGTTAGYVQIPSTGGPNPVLFGTELHAIIADVDTLGLCGWIVDLRGSSGGSMYGALAGLGPILGEGVVGAFADPDSVKQEWFYRDGEAGIHPAVGADGQPVGFTLDDFTSLRITGPAYQLITPSPAVAVLTGDLTNSAGEALATAFRGRSNTRSFGRGTAGRTTTINGFPMIDGALLALAVANFADRTGQTYDGPIEPDEVVQGLQSSDPASGDDPVVEAALVWLGAQTACSGVPYRH